MAIFNIMKFIYVNNSTRWWFLVNTVMNFWVP